MNAFRETLGQFREAMSAEAMRSPAPDLQLLLARERETNARRLVWSVAALAVFALCSSLAYRHAAQERADAALLQRVDHELAQPVPGALAPLMGIGLGAPGR